MKAWTVARLLFWVVVEAYKDFRSAGGSRCESALLTWWGLRNTLILLMVLKCFTRKE